MSLTALRTEKRDLPKPGELIQKTGLRYERRVIRALRARGFDLEHNPWFEWKNGKEFGICCPDAIVYELNLNRALVVEIKLSATVLALEKVRDFYCPIVSRALAIKTLPLIITRSIARMEKRETPIQTLWEAVDSDWPVYLWPGNGPIL